jgi:hypothetical protein
MNISKPKTLQLSQLSGVTLLRLISIGTNILVILLGLWVAIEQHKIATKPPAPYAITDTGAQMRLSLETPADRAIRIKNFVKKTMVGMYTWATVLDNKDPANSKSELLDAGVLITDKSGQSTPIPTAAFISTLGLEPNFAVAYQNIIAEYIRKYQIGPRGNNKSTVTFKVRQVSDPVEQGDGNWAVTLVGAQTIRSPTGKQTVINHAYKILARTSETMQVPDAMKKYKDRELAEFAAAISAYELEITNIIPL